jgi:predicted lipoprotein with Yx(FWY)xxD motif
MMKRNLIVSGLLLVGLVFVLALGSVFPAASTAQAQIGTATAEPATVQVAIDPNLGPILVDGKGMTLYLFQADTPGVSNCTGPCAAAWPPLTLTGGAMPTGSMNVTGKLGVITRADGSVQVTVNNLPLYYFIQDKAPGDVKGQGINAFGGLWYAVKPDGTPNTGMNK